MSTQIEPWQDSEESDLRKLLDALIAQRWLVLACVLISTVAFVTVALVMTPVYRATTVLVPASNERNSLAGSLNSTLGQLGGLASLAGVSLGSADSATEEALAVLRSRQFTERFINDLNLMPQLFAAKDWEKESPPTPARAFRKFKKIRTVTQDKKTGLVMLQIDWKDREAASNWTNELAARLNTEMRNRAIEQADASVNFLEKELAGTTVVETRQAINRLIEAQIKQRMLANVSQEYAFRVVDRAMAPDADDPLKPQKLVLFLLGPLVGLVAGIVGVLLLGLFRTPPRREDSRATAAQI
ncbi:MAG: Wzz/FepE/Etk N-terminal domain-containing protein [Steroidobacter sp.]